MARWAPPPACSCPTASPAAPAWSSTCASPAMVRSGTLARLPASILARLKMLLLYLLTNQCTNGKASLPSEGRDAHARQIPFLEMQGRMNSFSC